MRSPDPRICDLGVDFVSLDGVGDDLGSDHAFCSKGRQGGDDDVAGVNLEETPECLTSVLPAKTVGTECDEATGDPSADLVGNDLHVVGDRYHRTIALQGLGHE